MPDRGCGVQGLCLHTVANSIDDDADAEFVEVEPCGRYGRYQEVLGKGAFKTVYRAFDRVDGIEVAWNQVKVQDVLRTPEDLERLYSEVHLLRTLNHTNIIKFYHSWVDAKTKNVNFITEIFTSGTLRQYRKRHKDVEMKALKNWSRQILRGLHYLHSHDPPVIHRDLKCDNIFVNGNQGEVKIGDLGLATILLRARAAHSVIGTPEFMAPELYEEEYDELVDIYSFGMCLLELATFEYPYSECTNAAQIYKKVISGNKPEALSKVTDPELREFINKCLVTASKRLPARELLMDPFLRLEGDGKAVVEALPHIRRAITETDHMDALGVSVEESATEKISHRQKEMSPSFCESNFCSIAPFSPLIAGDEFKSLPCTHSKEERIGRSVEFRVKGKRREDDTVHLRLRIADSEGQVRNIHFPFDIEGDTAMCVASEMVAELDFTDQDVTKIAGMIDVAILTLVSEWNPGVAIDESCSVAIDNLCFPGEGEVLLDCHDSTSTAHDSYSKLHEVFNPLSVVPSENSHVGQYMLHSSSVYETPGLVASDLTITPHVEGTMHGRFEEVAYHRPSTFSSPLGIMAPDEAVPLQEEGTMHGRFEEVTYHCDRDHRDSFTEEVNCSMSSCSSDILKEAGHWDAVEEPTSPGSCMSPDSLPKCGFIEDCPSFEKGSRISQIRDVGAAFNELDASKGFVSYVHQVWDGLVPGGESCLDHCASPASLVKYKPCQHDIGSEDAHQVLSAPSSMSFFPSLDDNDKVVVQELQILARRHEQERRELQHKHEAALLELRNKWQQKRSSRFFSVSTGTHQCHSTLHGNGEGHGMQMDAVHELQLSECQRFISKQAISKFHRISSESNLKKRSPTEVLEVACGYSSSCKEL